MNELNEKPTLPIHGVSVSFTKENVIKIIKKRAENAFSVHNDFQKKELEKAIDIITRMMPPSSFPDW